MDLDLVWKDAIANVLRNLTDVKDQGIVQLIENQCSFEVSGNNIVFICYNDLASRLLPMYVSPLFREITTLLGGANASYTMQLTMAGSRPNQVQNQAQNVAAPSFDNAAPSAQNVNFSSNVQYAPNSNENVSGFNPQSQNNFGIPQQSANPQQNYGFQNSNSQPFNGNKNQNSVHGARITDNIDPNKTFENYITDPENRLAIAAAQKIAETPGSDSFNPFYIFGGSGLGKTHILWAIANKIRETRSNISVIYIRAEEFIRRYVDSMSNKTSFAPQQVHFQDTFTQYDVFIMDDIQSLTKGDKARDTFFDIIANFLDKKGKQLILASDVAPGNLKNFSERLVTRFGSGICCEIFPPSSETRTAIILRKCNELNFQLPDSVVEYIATNIRSSVREIEGAIKTLKSHVDIKGSMITYDEAVKSLANLVSVSSQSTTVDSIKDRVAKEFEVTTESLESAARKKNITQARSFAIALAHELIPTLSSSDLGRAFNKDHSSVLAAITRVEEWKSKDKDMNDLYQKLILSLKKN